MADETHAGRVLTYLRYEQLEGHLKGLRADSKKLESLVAKYGKIHDEGAGRRLLFTLKESGGLTDLRRRIGLHEQMLQLWYMTLVYGSLRRIESRQESMLCAMKVVKNLNRGIAREIQQALDKGDVKPLKRELCKSGLEPHVVDATLGTAVDYFDAPPHERARMESHAISSATVRPEASSFPPPPRPGYQEYAFGESFNENWPPYPPPPPMPHTHRRQHSSTQQPPHFAFWTEEDNGDDLTEDRSYDESRRKNKRDTRDRQKVENPPKKEREKPSKGHSASNLTADFGRPRSSSQTTKPTPPSPLLLVPDTRPRHRPASYHDPSDQYDRLSPDAGSRYKQEPLIFINRTPQRHRSVSREKQPVDRDRRDYSSYSYVRKRSSSRGDKGEESSER